jgi:hypothetical protein
MLACLSCLCEHRHRAPIHQEPPSQSASRTPKPLHCSQLDPPQYRQSAHTDTNRRNSSSHHLTSNPDDGCAHTTPHLRAQHNSTYNVAAHLVTHNNTLTHKQIFAQTTHHTSAITPPCMNARTAADPHGGQMPMPVVSDFAFPKAPPTIIERAESAANVALKVRA